MRLIRNAGCQSTVGGSVVQTCYACLRLCGPIDDEEVQDEEEYKMSGFVNTKMLKNWELLVKKGGDTRRYRDAFLEDECVFVVVYAIADFGMEHGICRQALTDYKIGALHERINRSGYCRDPYYPSEDDKAVDWSDGGDESEDEDGDSGEDEDGDDNHSED